MKAAKTISANPGKYRFWKTPTTFTYLPLSIIMLSATGCTPPNYLGKTDLQTYIQDESNGLSKTIQAGDITMKVSYRPNDFLIWQELEGENEKKASDVFARYQDYLYFMLQLSAGKKDALYGSSTGQADFNEKLQTLSFRMDQFVNMTTSKQDTIPVADFHYTRMFGLSRSVDLLFVFHKEQIQEAKEVAFNIREFGFGTGHRSFRFSTQQINDSPKLLELKPYYETH